MSPIIDKYVSNLVHVREYNDCLGRVEGVTNQLSNGLIQILKRLERNTGGDFIVLSDVMWIEPRPQDKVVIL